MQGRELQLESVCRESGTPYQGQPSSSHGEKVSDQSVSGQEQVVKSQSEGERSKETAPNAGQSGCKQEAKSKLDNVSTGQSQSGKEEVKPVKKPSTEGRDRGASETAKDEKPPESSRAKDSRGCSDKEKSTGASAGSGSTPVKVLGQKPAGERQHSHI